MMTEQEKIQFLMEEERKEAESVDSGTRKLIEEMKQMDAEEAARM